MKTANCPMEDKVRKALAAGGCDPALRDHAVRCPVCRDVMAISSWILKFRDQTLDAMKADGPLSVPEKWWDLARAGVTIDPAAATKALRPIYVYRKIAWFVSVGGGAVLAFFEFEKIKSLLASIPGLDALASMLRKTGESGGASLVPQVGLPAALGLAALVVLVLVTGIKRADAA